MGSQLGQDKLVDTILNKKRKGFFLDIGKPHYHVDDLWVHKRLGYEA